MNIRIKKFDINAKEPEFAHDTDAGADLFASQETVVPAHGRVLVPTGIGIALPDGYAGLIWDKSSIPTKYGITTLSGVLDSGYRGEIFIVVVNLTQDDYTFSEGDKVAQILFQKVYQPTMIEVDSFEKTDRGSEGFGSTGK